VAHGGAEIQSMRRREILMAASLSDILTAAQNIVKAINGAAQTYLSVQGTANVAGMTAATVVKASAGRVCTVSVIVGGAAGAIYDATSASATTNQIYVTPTTAGVYVVNIPTQYGIVVAPGSGQTLTVGYS